MCEQQLGNGGQHIFAMKRHRMCLVRTGANGFGVRGTEHVVFVPICQIPRLFKECRRNLRPESCIVNRLHGNVVVDLPIKLSCKGTIR